MDLFYKEYFSKNAGISLFLWCQMATLMQKNLGESEICCSKTNYCNSLLQQKQEGGQ